MSPNDDYKSVYIFAWPVIVCFALSHLYKICLISLQLNRQIRLLWSQLLKLEVEVLSQLFLMEIVQSPFQIQLDMHRSQPTLQIFHHDVSLYEQETQVMELSSCSDRKLETVLQLLMSLLLFIDGLGSIILLPVRANGCMLHAFIVTHQCPAYLASGFNRL